MASIMDADSPLVDTVVKQGWDSGCKYLIRPSQYWSYSWKAPSLPDHHRTLCEAILDAGGAVHFLKNALFHQRLPDAPVFNDKIALFNFFGKVLRMQWKRGAYMPSPNLKQIQNILIDGAAVCRNGAVYDAFVAAFSPTILIRGDPDQSLNPQFEVNWPKKAAVISDTVEIFNLALLRGAQVCNLATARILIERGATAFYEMFPLFRGEIFDIGCKQSKQTERDWLQLMIYFDRQLTFRVQYNRAGIETTDSGSDTFDPLKRRQEIFGEMHRLMTKANVWFLSSNLMFAVDEATAISSLWIHHGYARYPEVVAYNFEAMSYLEYLIGQRTGGKPLSIDSPEENVESLFNLLLSAIKKDDYEMVVRLSDLKVPFELHGQRALHFAIQNKARRSASSLAHNGCRISHEDVQLSFQQLPKVSKLLEACLRQQQRTESMRATRHKFTQFARQFSLRVLPKSQPTKLGNQDQENDESEPIEQSAAELPLPLITERQSTTNEATNSISTDSDLAIIDDARETGSDGDRATYNSDTSSTDSQSFSASLSQEDIDKMILLCDMEHKKFQETADQPSPKESPRYSKWRKTLQAIRRKLLSCKSWFQRAEKLTRNRWMQFKSWVDRRKANLVR